MEVCKHSLGDQAVIMPSHQPEFCLGARVRCNHYEMGLKWSSLLDSSSAKLLLLVWVLYLSMVQLLTTTCLTSAAHMK